MSLVKRYTMRFAKWGNYIAGKSYQHVPQGRGRVFQAGALDGYFNDLTGKAAGTGRESAMGVPIVETDTHPAFEMPIVIFQWALGNWDCWLMSGRADQGRAEAVLRAARWAVSTITEEGGWPCWTELKRPVISPYSAMAQGEALSLLARAQQIENDPAFLSAAQRAVQFLLNSGAHGLTRTEAGKTSLEEYPGEAHKSVLNGWIFALVGLKDHALQTRDSTLDARAASLAADLVATLPAFDTGYWSTYDRAGNIASPFYHSLHIAQLNALAEIFPEQADGFTRVATRFAGYETDRVGKTRAIVTKLFQKLRQSESGEMR